MIGFQVALEEAMLAENGFLDASLGIGHVGNPEADSSVVQSSQNIDIYSQNQAITFLHFLFQLVICECSLQLQDCDIA